VVRAFLGLGSNLGDRGGQLRRAVASLPDVVAVSRVYVTEPVGGPPGQDPYLNLVVELDTDLGPRDLLREGKRLEKDAGRPPTGVRWGPRPLDVDVLLVDDLAVDEPDLVIPHPRMWQRRFVTEPLRELAPELVPDDVRGRAGGAVQVAGTLESF
jgi:2-amino-4-hydroxy-6-hydroxymethyldihydropteridine diphosphokinase